LFYYFCFKLYYFNFILNFYFSILKFLLFFTFNILLFNFICLIVLFLFLFIILILFLKFYYFIILLFLNFYYFIDVIFIYILILFSPRATAEQRRQHAAGRGRASPPSGPFTSPRGGWRKIAESNRTGREGRRSAALMNAF